MVGDFIRVGLRSLLQQLGDAVVQTPPLWNLGVAVERFPQEGMGENVARPGGVFTDDVEIGCTINRLRQQVVVHIRDLLPQVIRNVLAERGRGDEPVSIVRGQASQLQVEHLLQQRREVPLETGFEGPTIIGLIKRT